MSNPRDRYHLDAEKVSLKQFQLSLENRKLIPSRTILKEKLRERFDVLSSAGIETLKDLIESLKNKAKIEAFSKQTGLAVDYLTVLKREASSYFPNPVALSKFPDVDSQLVQKLEQRGIKNSKHLFNAVKTNPERQKLYSELAIPENQIMELAYLSDLVRLYGVGPAFARLLFDVGIRSVESFLNYGPEKIIEIYEEKTGKKADFSVGDIQFSHEMARELDIIFHEQSSSD